MAVSQDDLEALDDAIAGGELQVEIDGREVRYRSIDELLKARRHLSRRLGLQNGRAPNPLAGIRTSVDRGTR